MITIKLFRRYYHNWLNRINIILYNLLYKIIFILFNQNKIVFLSNSEKDLYGNLTKIFALLNSKNKYISYKSSYILLNDIKQIYLVATSKVIITDTVNKIIRIINVSKITTIIFCGHGGGAYKKMAYACIPSNKQRTQKILQTINSFYGKISYSIATCTNDTLLKYLAQNYQLDKNRILPLGLARTDHLYNIDVPSIISQYEKKYPILYKKQKILYSPTYRTQKNKKRYMPIFLDNTVLEQNLSFNYIILFRGHPTIACQTKLPENWLNVTSLPLYDCLALADILITDYSSLLFDYSYFKRPIYLLVPDVEEYIKNECALWFSPAELLACYACYNTKELVDKLINPPANEHDIWSQHMDACDGSSCKRINDFILTLTQDLSKKNKGLS